ncbi:hypothetical protein BS78_01G515100 [Paspalum vaginatum]|nr:hypothetical protein BS78_01G515100 [Paspalum vaginatum]
MGKEWRKKILGNALHMNLSETMGSSFIVTQRQPPLFFVPLGTLEASLALSKDGTPFFGAHVSLVVFGTSYSLL